MHIGIGTGISVGVSIDVDVDTDLDILCGRRQEAGNTSCLCGRELVQWGKGWKGDSSMCAPALVPSSC